MACNAIALALGDVGEIGALVKKMMDKGMGNAILDRIVELMLTVDGVSDARKSWDGLRITFKGEVYNLTFRGTRWQIDASYGDVYEHQNELDQLLVQCTQFVGSELIALQTLASIEQMGGEVLSEEAGGDGVRRIKFRLLA